MLRRTPHVLATVAATVAAGLVAALTATVPLAAPAAAAETLDKKGLTKQVRKAAAAAYPEFAPTSVKCPKSIKVKKGATGKCKVATESFTLRLLVTVTDKKGRITIESTQAVIPKGAVEEFVKANATLPAQVDCGPEPYIVRPPGFPFTCTATFPEGLVQTVTVSPDDIAGNVTITQVQQQGQ